VIEVDQNTLVLRHLNSWNEITIPCNESGMTNLLFSAELDQINAELDVNPFLNIDRSALIVIASIHEHAFTHLEAWQRF